MADGKMSDQKSMEATAYPECDKLVACHEMAQAQGDFLDWLLNEKKFVLAKWDRTTMPDDGFERDELRPVACDVQKLLAEFHGIDLDKVEQERRAILLAFSVPSSEAKAPEDALKVARGVQSITT